METLKKLRTFLIDQLYCKGWRRIIETGIGLVFLLLMLPCMLGLFIGFLSETLGYRMQIWEDNLCRALASHESTERTPDEKV